MIGWTLSVPLIVAIVTGGIGIVRWVDGILEGEERVGEMFEGFADAIRDREREEDVGTAVVGGGRREVEAASTVFRPRLAV